MKPMKSTPKAKKAAKKKPAVKKKAAVKKPALKKVPEIQDFVFETLDKDKAKDIVVIPLKGKTSIADYMIIATGTSSRHVSSMAQKLKERLNAERKIKARLEGLATGDWAIIDAGDVMVHLFLPAMRERYGLEKLWQDATELPVEKVLVVEAARAKAPRRKAATARKPRARKTT